MAPADGIALGAASSGKGVSVRLLAPLDERKRWCWRAATRRYPFLSRDMGLRNFRMVRLGEDSNTALSYLAGGMAHVAGCHLFDEDTGQYNVAWVRSRAPFPCSVVTFAIREQGLIVAAGNPKGVSGVGDLSRA